MFSIDHVLGKKWEVLANAVSTKTISQIKKYYSDNFSRQKSNHHSSRDSKTKKSGLIVALDLSHKVGSQIVQTEKVK